jgi:carbon-monoxide dehydrogenase medium subunit
VHSAQIKHRPVTRYERPLDLEHAVDLLAESAPKTRVIAGGTDLLLEIERGMRSGIEVLIDVSGIPELGTIKMDDGHITLGAAVTHNQVGGSSLLLDRAFPLVQACLEIGSPQLRNRATVAGNLVTASPANDTITPLRALDSVLTIVSKRGSRRTSLADFHTDVRRTTLQPDEIITEISLRPMSPTERGIFVKLGLRRAQAISVVHLTALLDFDGEIVTHAGLFLGSVALTIVTASDAEVFLSGRTLTDAVIREAALMASRTVTPIDDIRATAAYRSEQTAVMVARALRALRDDRQREDFPSHRPTLSERRHPAPKEAVSYENSRPLTATVNGDQVTAGGGASKTLLDWLRDSGLTGTKEGCAEGECGACTVVLDGMAVMACLVPAAAAEGSEVVTVEGLEGKEGMHRLQQAFIDLGAVQCGYCIPGFLVAGAKLLEERPSPSMEEITMGLSGNLCRCTGYYKIIAAVRKASA